MRIVTGLGPHENLIRPPARTAATTAAEVQLRGVPLPITRVGVAAGATAGVEANPTTTASATGHAIAATRRVVIAAMLRVREHRQVAAARVASGSERWFPGAVRRALRPDAIACHDQPGYLVSPA
jgi:hypothetical protein